MEVGDLVMYNYGGHPYLGIIVEQDDLYPDQFFVMWTGKENEWEFEAELEAYS